MSKDLTQNTAALKTLVGVLTVLLLAGMVLFVIGMMRAAGELEGDAPPLQVTVPAGYRLQEVRLSDDRLLLHLEPQGEGASRILVFDLENGRRVGDVTLVPEP